jgi:hypothetical protein
MLFSDSSHSGFDAALDPTKPAEESIEIEIYVPTLICKHSQKTEHSLITSLCTFNDKAILGLSTGSINVYFIGKGSSDNEEAGVTAELIESFTNVSTQPIEKLGILKDVGSLVALTDNHVSIYDLTTLTLDEKLLSTKGASDFAIYSGISELSPEVGPIPILRLLIACRRRLVCYEWRDSDFFEYKEIYLPDLIRTLSFINLNQIVCGLTSEYVTVNIISNELNIVPFFPGGKSLIDNIGFNYFGIGGDPRLRPHVIGIPHNKTALLVKGGVSQFINEDGQLVNYQKQFKFQSFPSTVELVFPYFLCILPTHVEVRNIETFTLLQTLDIPDVLYISIDKHDAYLATSHEVYQLAFTDLKQQIVTLSNHKGHLLEAICLVDHINQAILPEKQSLLRELKIHHATDLFFKRKRYMQALVILSEVSAAPTDVIEFFPSQISGPVSSFLDHLNEDNLVDSMSISSRQKTIVSSISKDDSPSADDLESQLNSPDTESTSFSAKPDLTGRDLHIAIRGLENFLADTRRKVSALLRTEKDSTKDDNLELLRTFYGSNIKSLEKTANIVDTTMFKCYTLKSKALVGPLLRIHNYCDADVVKPVLLKLEKYQELIDFYFNKGLHTQALKQLRALSDDENINKQFKGPSSTVKYLQKLGNDNLDVIFEFATWPISVKESFGSAIFLNRTQQSDSLDVQKVIQYLQKTSKLLTIRYLEYVTREKGDMSPNLHTALAIAFVEFIKCNEDDEIIFAQARQFLNITPRYYRIERILSSLPQPTTSKKLLEFKAILYGKRGQHEEALRIYTFEIRNDVKARGYCSELYDQDKEAGVTALHSLITLYLAPPIKNEPQRLNLALTLLSSQGSRMSVVEIINKLPDSTSIQQIAPFLTSQVRTLKKIENNIELKANLNKVNLVKTQEQLLVTQNKCGVTVTNTKTCKVCFKRLGLSVISVFPDNVVVHYGCSKIYQNMLDKKTQETSNKLIEINKAKYSKRHV